MRLALNTIAAEPNRWNADKSLARPIEETLDLIARAGYEAAEIWQYHLTNRDAAETPVFAERAKSLGIDVPVVGGYPLLHLSDSERQDEMDRAERLMDDCETFGAGILKVFCGRIGSDVITPEQRSLSMAFLRELTDRAADRGITVTAETHGRTLADSVVACEALLSELNAANFKLCYQPFNLMQTASALSDFDALKESIAHVHLQGRDENGFCLMKDASLDYGAFVRHIKASGFDGVLSVEFVKGSAPRDLAEFRDEEIVASATQDRQFVQAIWNE